MSSSIELEQLYEKKAYLTEELQSICKEEDALKEMVKILEEKLESEPPSLTTTHLEYGASPEKVYSLYTS